MSKSSDNGYSLYRGFGLSFFINREEIHLREYMILNKKSLVQLLSSELRVNLNLLISFFKVLIPRLPSLI